MKNKARAEALGRAPWCRACRALYHKVLDQDTDAIAVHTLTPCSYSAPWDGVACDIF